jgi:hypothetical protein
MLAPSSTVSLILFPYRSEDDPLAAYDNLVEKIRLAQEMARKKKGCTFTTAYINVMRARNEQFKQ